MEIYAKPTVQNYPENTSTRTVDINLSATQESTFTVVVPAKQEVPQYDHDAFLILGPDGEKPEWEKRHGSPLVDITDRENPQPKTEVTLMTLPREALIPYVGKEVQLRYRTYGETQQYRYSEPITLNIQA
ncbi:hypothetical protein [Pseudomonas sp. Z4-7]|uniref:hypothetical protein n=1 Tax=unclassified Pseudomonas TaxID=196821 RepID=UPI003DA7F518